MIWVIAHRGASAVRPENTIEAFLEARRLGADAVELDVRRSADGALVVHHDAVLADGRPIAELTVSDLPASVPLLDAAVDACEDMAVNVEIKNLPTESDHDPSESLAYAVAAFVVERGLQERVVVSSFSLATLDAVTAAEPGVATGWLTLSGYDQDLALETSVERGHAAFHPHHTGVTEQLVAAAHRAGLAVTTWTVDDADRIRELDAMGLDAVITNVPDVARAALAAGDRDQGTRSRRQSGSWRRSSRSTSPRKSPST